MEKLSKDAKENKKDRSYTSGSKDDQIATGYKFLLDTMRESYGFSSDLIETINQ